MVDLGGKHSEVRGIQLLRVKELKEELHLVLELLLLAEEAVLLIANPVVLTELVEVAVMGVVEEIQAVLADLKKNENWYYPLFLVWLSTGMRNGEIRGLTWDCVRWEDGEVLVCKSLRRDGYSSGQHSWAPTKTGRERLVPLTPEVLDTLKALQAA
jgi:integrase